jgi:cell division septation protein DedD
LEQTAKSQWAKLKQNFPSELAQLAPSYHKVTLPERGTIFRLQAGTFATRDAAAKICDKLKASKQDCFVVRL